MVSSDRMKRRVKLRLTKCRMDTVGVESYGARQREDGQVKGLA
jgi:hypothetical protein